MVKLNPLSLFLLICLLVVAMAFGFVGQRYDQLVKLTTDQGVTILEQQKRIADLEELLEHQIKVEIKPIPGTY